MKMTKLNLDVAFSMPMMKTMMMIELKASDNDDDDDVNC